MIAFQVKGSICCAVSHVVALVNLVVSKVLALVNLVVDKVMSLPWACILDTVSSLGSNALVALVFHALTDDLLCLTFPVVNLVLPLLLAKVHTAPFPHYFTYLTPPHGPKVGSTHA